MTIRFDEIKAKDGSIIRLRFYAHASVGIVWNGINIYVDPVGEKYGIDYSQEPKADLILITHHHKDHQDSAAVALLSKVDTMVFRSVKCDEIEGGRTLRPNSKVSFNGIAVETIPAYNTTTDHLRFHPMSDFGLGYVLTLGGTRILVAGDTEDTPELVGLGDIDVAFLPVNQPYTMTVEQAVRAAMAIRPKIFYPYHYGSQQGVTDVSVLTDMLSDVCEVRIRNMN